jgi:hypothetical protein
MPIGRGLKDMFEGMGGAIKESRERDATERAFNEWLQTPEGQQAKNVLGYKPDEKIKAQNFMDRAAYAMKAYQLQQKAQPPRMQIPAGYQQTNVLPPGTVNMPDARGGHIPVSAAGGPLITEKPPKHDYKRIDAFMKNAFESQDWDTLKALERMKAAGMSPEEIYTILEEQGALKKETKSIWKKFLSGIKWGE